MVEEAGYDDQIRAALEALERLNETQPEYYSRLVDLGDLQAHAGDDFAAEKTLLKAESGLDRAKWSNPTGADLANALVATLQGIQTEKSVPARQNIQTSLQVRGLYRRIHLRLADVYERLGDLAKAEQRLNLAREMDRSSPDDEFSKTMLNNLAGEWKDLFR
jgi:tetratricopeptide (TPR) repeat protein